MDKICVDVFVPSINKKYDIVLAPELTVYMAAEYIYRTISEYEALGDSPGGKILCSMNQKRILDGDITLNEADLKDGSRLMLI